MRSLGKRPDGLRLERMKASPRWSGEGFRNVHPILPGLRDQNAAMPSLQDFLCGGERRVPATPLPALDPKGAWARNADTGLRVTWLGHSTVLLEIDGYRVLTDPVWGSRASPLRLVGPKRFQPVPVAIDILPTIDAVVISHDHYDHLDYPTIRALAKLNAPFITSLGVGSHLEYWGVPGERIFELDWWETHQVKGTDLTVTATPSQHFSGRGLNNRNGTLWSSMTIRAKRHSVFFSGDTGLTTEFADICKRVGPFDLVMLEVGGHHPAWGDIHLGPDNALKALSLLGGGPFLPIHWGTFALSTHEWDQPVETLLARAPKDNVHLLLPQLGEPIEPARERKVLPWWRATESHAAPLKTVEPDASKLTEVAPYPFD